MVVTIENRRERSPLFPYVGLEQSIEYSEQLFSKARRSVVRLSDAAMIWGHSPTSSSVLRIVAALTTFGLAEDSGSGDERKVQISELALRILEDDRVGAKEEGKREAAAKAHIIVDVHSKWGDERPSDPIALSALKFDFGFGSSAAKRFLRVYDNTVPFLKERIRRPDVEIKQTSSDHDRLEGQDLSNERESNQSFGTIRNSWFTAKLPDGPTASILTSREMTSRNLGSLIRLLEVLHQDMLEAEKN